MAVHGAIFLSRLYHSTKQPLSKRDEFVQKGEIISLWEPTAEEEVDHSKWGCPWHINNPEVQRLVFPDHTLDQIDYIASEFKIPFLDDPIGNYVAAKRLWQLDIDALVNEEVADTGENKFNISTEVVTIGSARFNRLFKRGDGGLLKNKSAGDVSLIYNSRAIPRRVTDK